MNINRQIIITTITAFFSLVAFNLQAQQKLHLASDSDFKVEGSSTLHDWEMISSNASGEAQIKLNNDQIESIATLVIRIPVKSLKSGKGQMDKNAYDAMEASKHPTIHFKLEDIQQITDETIKASGTLTIAGTTKPVNMEVKYQVSGSTVKLDGDTTFRLTEFEIDPPTAMFGAVKAGDEVQVSFDTEFSPAGN